MQTKIHEHFYSAKFVKHVSDEMPWAARNEFVEIKINNSEKFYGPVSPEMVNWNNKSRRADSQVTHYRIFVPHETWQDRVYQSINEQLLPSIISEINSIDTEIAKLTERRSLLMKQLLSTYM